MITLAATPELPNAFSTAQYITHPIALAAYVTAAIMTYFVIKNVNQRKAIESAAEKDRADIIIKTAEKLNVDLKDVPENERPPLVKQLLGNRIRTQIIIAATIVILGLIIAYLVVFNLATSIKEQHRAESVKENAVSTEAMRTIQSSFSVKGITLEGEAVNLLADSQKLGEDWIKWFGGTQVKLTTMTGTLDTLIKFANRFRYARTTSEFEDLDFSTLSVTSGQKLKQLKLNLKRTSPSILATDPNGSPEWAFTTNVGQAMHIFGFTKMCIAEPSDYEDFTGPGTAACTPYLTPKGLKWLTSHYSFKDMGGKTLQILDDGEEHDESDYRGPIEEIAASSKQLLKFYNYVTHSNPPPNFIHLRCMAGDGCNGSFDSQTVKVTFSTPPLSVKALAIKNESNRIITVNNLKFLYTENQLLRTDADDFKSKKKELKYDQNIKLKQGEQLLIPIQICFNRINRLKSLESGISLKETDRTYYYGKAFYLDSIGIDGYNFPIKQAAREHVVKAYYASKFYEEYGSCPYLYTYNEQKKRFDLENHIIYKKNSPRKIGYDTLKLKNIASEMIIAEIDDEISYIDRVFLLRTTANGRETVIPSQSLNLVKIDGNYLVLRKGEKVHIKFPLIRPKKGEQYSLVSYGYYKSYGKAYEPKPYLSKNL